MTKCEIGAGLCGQPPTIADEAVISTYLKRRVTNFAGAIVVEVPKVNPNGTTDRPSDGLHDLCKMLGLSCRII